MNGYSDPRLPLYADPAPGSSSGEIVGARSGVFHYNILKSETTNYSYPKVTTESKLLSISSQANHGSLAPRVLSAAGKWAPPCQGNSEEGVRVSMKERGAEIGNYPKAQPYPPRTVAPRQQLVQCGRCQHHLLQVRHLPHSIPTSSVSSCRSGSATSQRMGILGRLSAALLAFPKWFLLSNISSVDMTSSCADSPFRQSNSQRPM